MSLAHNWRFSKSNPQSTLNKNEVFLSCIHQNGNAMEHYQTVVNATREWIPFVPYLTGLFCIFKYLSHIIFYFSNFNKREYSFYI